MAIDKENNPDYLNEFLSFTRNILNKSPNTVKEYNYDLNTFLQFIKCHKGITKQKDIKEIYIQDLSFNVIKNITITDLYDYLTYLADELNNKPATRARKVASIKTFFNYLTKKASTNYRLEINPAQNLETPKQEKRMPKYLSLDESKDLLNITKNPDNRNNLRDYAIVTLFLNCGMRLSELVGINLKDINFKDEKLTVIGKGNKERTIYLNKACINAICEYIEVRPKDGIKVDARDALFLSERKTRISTRAVQYIVKNDLLKAGLDIEKYSVHKLRHTAATLMYKYGNVDIRALQELLGHASISTTEIYTHVDNSQVRAAVESNPLANL